ncbi:hypothetical protein AAG570_000094 [Ranatra chinensis]|uniref:Uncharacterized protein n=1 Tax=Ranatra chinensis TaxID=642074 RepID=A0ABD0YW27_9HEMI
MAFKRRNMSEKNTKQETTEIGPPRKTELTPAVEANRFFKALSGLFGGILAIFNVSIIVMLTTLGFIITDPKRTSQDLATLGVLLVEELIAAFGFCWFGQKVHDEGCALTSALYTDVDWHLLPYTSRKTLLLMVIRSQRPMIIKGWTRDYTLSGLSDILQGAYSFFNMLVAFRSGNK